MVIVDTTVWSLALRRRTVDLSEHQFRLTQELDELVREDRARLLGSTRQEILSGIRDDAQFERIRSHLRIFEDVKLSADDYEEAARMSNRCSRSGIASSAADMLICAVSGRRHWQVFSTDRDFAHYRHILGIRLFSV